MSDKPIELPPELRDLEGLATAADAQLAGADLPPGATPPAEVDEAAALAGMLNFGMTVGGKVLPTLPKYFTAEACTEISSAYLECAAKYGWTWHQKAGGPELRLGLAVSVPAVLCFIETKQLLAERRAQAELEQRQAQGQRDPLAPAVPALPAP